jgi:hypothetical protein
MLVASSEMEARDIYSGYLAASHFGRMVKWTVHTWSNNKSGEIYKREDTRGFIVDTLAIYNVGYVSYEFPYGRKDEDGKLKEKKIKEMRTAEGTITPARTEYYIGKERIEVSPGMPIDSAHSRRGPVPACSSPPNKRALSRRPPPRQVGLHRIWPMPRVHRRPEPLQPDAVVARRRRRCHCQRGVAPVPGIAHRRNASAASRRLVCRVERVERRWRGLARGRGILDAERAVGALAAARSSRKLWTWQSTSHMVRVVIAVTAAPPAAGTPPPRPRRRARGTRRGARPRAAGRPRGASRRAGARGLGRGGRRLAAQLLGRRFLAFF